MYQEQIMRIIAHFVGCSLADADLLRHGIAQKRAHGIDRMRQQLPEPAVARLLIQAPPAFLKSHAAAYSLVAYQMAWIKANYPRDFTAVLRQ